MKILFTVHQFLPDFGAGTEILTLSVARELMARGHEVVVLAGQPNRAALTDGERFEEYDYDDVHVHRFHHAYLPMGEQNSVIELEYDNLLVASYFRRLLAELKPDIVHFFHFGRLGTALIDEAVNFGVPAFFTPTDFWAICPIGRLTYSDGTPCSGPSLGAANCAMHLAAQKFGPIAERLIALVPDVAGEVAAGLGRTNLMPVTSIRENLRAIKRRLPTNISRLNDLNQIVTPNQMIESHLLQQGVSKAKITRAAYGIDLKFSLTTQPKIRTETLRIGFIGTLAPHKGCHTLIDAFNALDNNLATLKVYGSELDFPGYVKKLRCKSKGNPSVTFNGTFPNSDISRVFDELDVLIVPSTWPENTPLIVYSAQAARCPVVASNVPGIAEAIRPGVDGLLFEKGNHHDLALCLQRLISEPDLVEQLSANTVPPRSTSDYVNNLLRIWNKEI